MADTSLKEKLSSAVKDAMRSKDKDRLVTLRMAQAAVKQIEVDERRELTDDDVLKVLDKMLKQRRDAAAQYDDAGRGELADKERSEMVIIEEFMPAALSEDDLDALIRETINATGASGMQDMGNVMNELKPQVLGRVDMGHLSKKVRAALAG
ncbi:MULTISPECIES: GatB/YqeY domain-containing protein [Marinobacter]|uniref:GatB/YqeY domain-containing protein n=2 Tax=Marinobacter nauticus TaxID=2743 RepID=A0A368UNG0_MARNT|nr:MULTISPECIES: GatB/YqeY domain-containing protein [Marinobacter]MCG8522402.1 GatB/YqeY domain-containing protein [Pseudomonadales bacterium]MEC8897909.1 GatB/YqeY domain-containing protein [Pseudomonadota bacterium]ABM20022.1 GatB/Yqey domain protein [Marinobacter nauticus VT8]KAE8545800.1 Transamidase GatB domain protein [Marinobacter nauticus]MAL33387.1 glutamyl-tRNA amidotransferase [Marinobacter sp.]